ncbi:MAG: aminoacetone oxidase family FAD-binding enzyme [Clostridia bacterium]
MKVIVVGAGAAGIMAAINAAKNKNEVILLEKTTSIANKLKITGKGRCNLTFDGDIENFKQNIVKNYKFMYSSFTNFDNKKVVEYFNKLGVKTKVERGARIFPESDDSATIVDVLKKELKKYSVDILYSTTVTSLVIENKKIKGVKLQNKSIINCDKCIIATGGKSYETTGSTGDGYTLARSVGHHIVDLKAGLVPLRSNDKVCKILQGLSLKNVGIKIFDSNKEIYTSFGELLFTHFGLSGPIILSASSKLNRIADIDKKLVQGKIYISIDLKKALDLDTLDKRICRDFEKYANKEFKNSLNDLLPQKIIPQIILMSQIDENKKVHQITKNERQILVNLIKNFKINITGFMPIDIAIITCGGVDVVEVNPKTMESKFVFGLYFAGEVLDVDGYTGGYNLQIAFSTAIAASSSLNIN